ncbi:hypothetical protein [Umezawaea tangerina]|uniref:Uncharacterized protein n=1 Tax=Umezawaea tangerina TaxID=84725 RepID=A0A2T0TK00_9PSEU|nr:hypothetical protein [Umezawaea tangerina]PRY46044.1 hypothetical protein CLV43_101308 [Umezawaea tangerina]
MRFAKNARLAVAAFGLVALALLAVAPGSAGLADQPGSVRITG